MKATDLPSWAWRNPEDVAARLEEMSCSRCLFRVELVGIAQCVKHLRRFGSSMYRCGDYLESKR